MILSPRDPGWVLDIQDRSSFGPWFWDNEIKENWNHELVFYCYFALCPSGEKRFPLFTFSKWSLSSSFWIFQSSFVDTFHPKIWFELIFKIFERRCLALHCNMTTGTSNTASIESSWCSVTRNPPDSYQIHLQLLFWHLASCSSDCWVTKRSFSRNDWSSSLKISVRPARWWVRLSCPMSPDLDLLYSE